MPRRKRAKKRDTPQNVPSIPIIDRPKGVVPKENIRWYCVIRVYDWEKNGPEIVNLCDDVIRPVIEEKIARPRRNRKKEPRTVVRPLFYEYVAVATHQFDALRSLPGVIEILMMDDTQEFLIRKHELLGMIERHEELPEGVKIEFLDGHLLAGQTGVVRRGRIVLQGKRDVSIRLYDPRFMRTIDKGGR